MRHSVKLVANDNNEFWGELFVGKVCDRGRKCKLWECIWQSGKVLSLSFNMVCGVGRKCSAFKWMRSNILKERWVSFETEKWTIHSWEKWHRQRGVGEYYNRGNKGNYKHQQFRRDHMTRGIQIWRKKE